MFQGRCLQVRALPDGFVELRFERRDPGVGGLDRETTDELRTAVAILSETADARGVLVTGGENAFLPDSGRDASGGRFQGHEDGLARSLWRTNEALMAFEDLQMPTVVAITGRALGGGCAFVLTASHRVMADDAWIGMPLDEGGLLPGFGGTVRLPRVASPAIAIDWITSGHRHDAPAAHAAGVVDAVAPHAALRDRCLGWLSGAARGEVDWRSRQVAKRAPVAMPLAAHRTLFAQAIEACASQPPAMRAAIELMARTTLLPRDAAQWQECEAIARAVCGGAVARASVRAPAREAPPEARRRSAVPAAGGEVVHRRSAAKLRSV